MRRPTVSALLAATMALLFAAPALATPVESAAAIITHAPMATTAGALGGTSAADWSSSNWSGYAETGTFTGVSSTWTVPAVSSTSGSSYSSAWIGVDGFNDSNLIQTGTEQDYYSGSAHYDAWWEILPAAETEISTTTYPIAPGNEMSASIWETSTTETTGGGGGFGRHGGGGTTEHVWDISLSDVTKGWTFTTSQGYAGAGTSAEWIMEAPEVNGKIATLAHYTTTPSVSGQGDFDSAGILKTIPTGNPTYTGAALSYASDSGTMVQSNVTVSTPGDPDTAGTAFNVAYGSTLPATPTS
jgi:hypothetical protein